MTDVSEKQPTDNGSPAEEGGLEPQPEPDHEAESGAEDETAAEEIAADETIGDEPTGEVQTLAPASEDGGKKGWRAYLPSLKRFEDKLAVSLGITKPRDRFLFDTGFNFVLVLAVVLPLDLLFQYATQDSNSLSYYQIFMAHLLVWILNTAGVTTTLATAQGGGPVVVVDGLTAGWEIAASCTGLHETLFIGLLVLLFRGVRVKVRVKWAAIFAVIIFFENLIRILSGYPIERSLGFASWDKLHYYWWNYGQYMFIMLLFIIWVNTAAYRDLLDQRKQKRKGRGGEGQDIENGESAVEEPTAEKAELPLASQPAESYSGSP